MKSFSWGGIGILAVLVFSLVLPRVGSATTYAADCGTVVINSNIQSAGWVIQKPDGTVYSGTGSGTFTNLPAGYYAYVRIDNVSGYSMTNNGTIGQLVGCGTLTSNITYKSFTDGVPPSNPLLNTIVVTSNLANGAYYITPAGSARIGWRGSHVFTDMPIAAYKIDVDPVPGYTVSVAESSSTTVAIKGSTLYFLITYTSNQPTITSAYSPSTATGDLKIVATPAPTSIYNSYTPSLSGYAPATATYIPSAYTHNSAPITTYDSSTYTYAPAAGPTYKPIALNEQLLPAATVTPRSSNAGYTTSTTSNVSLADIQNGQAIQSGTGPVWLVKITNYGATIVRSRRQVPNSAFRLNGISKDKILAVSDAVLTRIPVANVIRVGTGRNIYLIQFSGTSGTRRLFPNTATFLNMGYTLDEVQTITSSEYVLYKAGSTLPKTTLPVSLNQTPAPSLTADISQSISSFLGKLKLK